MKQSATLLLILLALLSCKKEQNTDPLPIKVRVDIGTDTYSLSKGISANESCESLFASFNYYRGSEEFGLTDFPYTVQFQFSKNGDPISIQLEDDKNKYNSSPFAIKRFTTVSNFEYNETDRVLSLTLKTTLFNRKDLRPLPFTVRFDKIPIATTDCSGTIPVGSFTAGIQPVNGTGTFYSRAEISSETNNLFSTGSAPTYYRSSFYLNDGYRITFENSSGLKNVKKGTYAITSDSESPFKVTFKTYSVPSDPYNFDLFVDKDWQTYRVVGNVEIDKEYSVGQRTPDIGGKLTFTAYDQDNKPVYYFRNGTFGLNNLMR